MLAEQGSDFQLGVPFLLAMHMHHSTSQRTCKGMRIHNSCRVCAFCYYLDQDKAL